ncbi:MAG: quinolinate synthase NadA [Sarcina sp.]
MNYVEKIKELKKEKNIIILAHYYVNGEIQDLADFVGDSLELSKLAQETTADIICFCGVNFMGESAKLLSPSKKVIMPDLAADCPMAAMINKEKIKEMRNNYKDLTVVAYVNTTAEVKSFSDICVTSSNAIDIVSKIDSNNIFFIPDKNLGSYVATKVPYKNIIPNKGFCCVHEGITLNDIELLKELHPEAKVLIHPECPKNTLALADCIGSTKALLEYVKSSNSEEFIIGTEIGIIHQMKKFKPLAKFYVPTIPQVCRSMKKNTLEKLYNCLAFETGEIFLDDNLIDKAKKPLESMIQLSK